MLRTARFFLICAPLVLALAACASPPPADTASLQAQIAATNRKADQALATARQAMTESQAAPAAPMANRAAAVAAPRRQPSPLVERVQRALARDGFYRGTLDGLFGPQTRAAVVQFQQQNGLRPTGRLDRATLDKLKQPNSSRRGYRWPKLPKPTSASAADPGRLAMAAIDC
jgi:peptidoglycan hydrolase-like protein with peptidoglycan-binding domain